MQGHLVRDDLFGRVVLTTAMLQPDLVRSYALDPKRRHFLPEDGAEPLNDGITRQSLYLFSDLHAVHADLPPSSHLESC